jgi:hypothetical protein
MDDSDLATVLPEMRMVTRGDFSSGLLSAKGKSLERIRSFMLIGYSLQVASRYPFRR